MPFRHECDDDAASSGSVTTTSGKPDLVSHGGSAGRRCRRCRTRQRSGSERAPRRVRSGSGQARRLARRAARARRVARVRRARARSRRGRSRSPETAWAGASRRSRVRRRQARSRRARRSGRSRPSDGTSQVRVKRSAQAAPARTNGRAAARIGRGFRVRSASQRNRAASAAALKTRRRRRRRRRLRRLVEGDRDEDERLAVTSATAIERRRVTTTSRPRPTSAQSTAPPVMDSRSARSRFRAARRRRRRRSAAAPPGSEPWRRPIRSGRDRRKGRRGRTAASRAPAKDCSGGVGTPGRRARARASAAQRPPTAARRDRDRRTRAAAPRGSSSARGGCRDCRPADGRSRRSHDREADAASASPGFDQASEPAVAATIAGMSVVPAISAGTVTARTARPRRRPRSSDHGWHPSARSRWRHPRMRPRAQSASVPVAPRARACRGRPPARRQPAHRHEQDGAHERGGDDGWCEPVDGRGSLDLDRGLAPKTAELAVGLDRARAPAALKPGLPVLDKTRQQRRKQQPAHDLDGAGGPGDAAHPSTPSRAAARSTSTSTIR